MSAAGLRELYEEMLLLRLFDQLSMRLKLLPACRLRPA